MGSPQTYPLPVQWISLVAMAIGGLSVAAQPDLPGCVWTQFRYPQGQLASQGCLVSGQPEGVWDTYHENGALKSRGSRKNHLLDGTWTFFNEQGVLLQEVTYERNEKSGWEMRFGTEGQLLEKIPYTANVRQGEALFYDRSGAIHKRIPFDKDQEHGMGFEFAPDGRMIARLDYYRGYLRGIERINRYDEMGLKTGMWVLFNAQGGVQEEGPYVRDLRHGVFKFYDAKGELMRLERYSYGQLEAPDETTMVLDIRTTLLEDGSRRTGSYFEGEAHGIFRTYDAQGNLVSGALFEKGKRVAEGITDRDGLRTGLWRFFDAEDRCIAEGNYERGLRQGEWKYFNEQGVCIQRGSFRDDLFHGEWVWYYPSQNLHRREHYRKGKEDGTFEEWDEAGGLLLQGSYVDGLRQGEWVYHVNDHKEMGSYVDGEPDGLWEHFYESGQKRFEGSFIQGEPDGVHRYWRPDGTRSVIEVFSVGQPDGTWTFYGEDPTVQHTREYRNGVLFKVDGVRVTASGEEQETEETE